MEIRTVYGQEGSWREELYNRDSQENPGGKGKSRRDFLVDIAERVGGQEGEKGEGGVVGKGIVRQGVVGVGDREIR